jgi:hypothetical protein
VADGNSTFINLTVASLDRRKHHLDTIGKV